MAPLSDIDRLIQAPDPILRAVLLGLCGDYKIRLKATHFMDQLVQRADAAKDAAKDTARDAGSLKRKAATQPHICVQCEEVFTDDDNAKNACSYHPGMMEPDYESDFWADHDENCHGIIDSEESREEYPEGFLWDCCNRIGTDPGCESSRHEAHPYKRQESCDILESDENGLAEGCSEQEGGNGKDENKDKERDEEKPRVENQDPTQA